MAYIEFKNVKKIYKMGDVKIRALNGVDFKIDKGEFAVVLGPSGADWFIVYIYINCSIYL